MRQLGRFGAQRGNERREHLRRGLRFDIHPAGVVQHPAAYAEPLRQIVHEGAKAHPLHYAGDGDVSSDCDHVRLEICRFFD